jgi:hypothetical protein
MWCSRIAAIAGVLYPHKILYGKIDALIPPPLIGYTERKCGTNQTKGSQGERSSSLHLYYEVPF